MIILSTPNLLGYQKYMKKRTSNRRSSRKKQQKLLIFERWVLFGIFLSLLVFIFVTNVNKVIFSKKPVLETPKSEEKILPADVKKQLEIKPASISATLRIPILMYHYVEYVKDKKDVTRESLNISPYTFEQQIKTLNEAGYTFLTAKDFADVLNGTMSLPSRPILITLDDGHWDVDTVVLPILKKYHAKATIYIIPAFIGGSDFLSSSQLKDIIATGLVEIGAHTVHHVSLKGKLLPLVVYEVIESKIMLENAYHIHVSSFAYPFGSFDLQAIKAVQEAGFSSAMSTIPGMVQSQQNRFFLYRLRPGYRTGDVLINYLNQNTFREF